ncbi:MAG: nucleoid-associated protein [Chryseolinea sp.]
MIEISQTSINAITAHGVGNKNNEGKLKLSDQPITIEGGLLSSLLTTYFLSGFRSLEQFSFRTENENDEHPVMPVIQSIFEDPESIQANSILLAQRLYEITEHPNIKAGELYIVHFSNVGFEDGLYDAVGIFKSETRDNYIQVDEGKKGYKLSAQQGLNINKLDKGCLILNDLGAEGYRMLLVDNANRSDASFWKHDFLGASPLKDAFHHTQNFMTLTRQYVDDQLDEEFSVSKADKIDLLNKSKDFFNTRDQFNQKEFESEVLADKSVIESFRKYEKTFMTDADIAKNFEISANAVKKQARVFKSVLKLDKNFHIYIHGNRELIEKGYDDLTRRHYYKFYFDQES